MSDAPVDTPAVDVVPAEPVAAEVVEAVEATKVDAPAEPAPSASEELPAQDAAHEPLAQEPALPVEPAAPIAGEETPAAGGTVVEDQPAPVNPMLAIRAARRLELVQLLSVIGPSAAMMNHLLAEKECGFLAYQLALMSGITDGSKDRTALALELDRAWAQACPGEPDDELSAMATGLPSEPELLQALSEVVDGIVQTAEQNGWGDGQFTIAGLCGAVASGHHTELFRAAGLSWDFVAPLAETLAAIVLHLKT